MTRQQQIEFAEKFCEFCNKMGVEDLTAILSMPWGTVVFEFSNAETPPPFFEDIAAMLRKKCELFKYNNPN